MKAGPRWQALPRGVFSGIEWSVCGAADGMDPYLAWAEADHFAGYQASPADAPPQWLPIAIELTAQADVPALVAASSVDWLQIPRVYLNLPALRFCTAHVKPRFFERLRHDPALRGLIRRFELGLPVGHHTRPIHDPCTPGSPPWPIPERLGGRVLGLIDGGLALANSVLLDAAGRTRVRHFWRQDDTQDTHGPRGREPLDPARAGPRPCDMGRGHELSGAAIDAAMAAHRRHGQLDEDALYHFLQLRGLDRSVDHGTHVMSLAAGAGSLIEPRDDAASRCDLIAVQLDLPNVRDTSGGAMNVGVLDALMYMLARCTTEARLVVNISWGTLAGPHDGSSLLEAAMDQLIELHGGRLQITLPAGNGYQTRTHANATLAPGQVTALRWRVLPDDRTQSYLEIWLAEGAQDVVIGVTPPGEAVPLPALRQGQSGLWTNADGQPLCGLIYPRRSALGRRGTCALLALAPTFSHLRGVATAPFGAWQVHLANTGSTPVVFDAWIERDDVALGEASGARQSCFEDAPGPDKVDSTGGMDRHDDKPPIRRSGSFNSIATGRHTVSVGGVRREASVAQHFAAYSPRRPDPDASRAQRPGVTTEPDTLAASDDNVVLRGRLGAGSRSQSAVRLVGTSSAAPQEARRLLNAA